MAARVHWRDASLLESSAYQLDPHGDRRTVYGSQKATVVRKDELEVFDIAWLEGKRPAQ